MEGTGTEPQEVTLALANLAPLTTYHYRLSATNANGTSQGQSVEFTTPGTSYSLTLPPAPSLLSVPAIAFPPEAGAGTGTPKGFTNAQKLANALKSCEAKKTRRKRASCKASAHRRYGSRSETRKKPSRR